MSREQMLVVVQLAIRAEMDRQEMQDRRPVGGFVNNYNQPKIAAAAVDAVLEELL